MRLCPCGEGQIEGKLRAAFGATEEKPPLILCPYCSDVYAFNWRLNWDGWEGLYWYGWKMELKS